MIKNMRTLGDDEKDNFVKLAEIWNFGIFK